MRRLLYSFLVGALLGCLGAAEREPSVTSDTPESIALAEICKTVRCRKPQLIRLKLESGETFESTAPWPTPIVSGDFVTVMPGEAILVEAGVRDNRLVDLIAVDAVTSADRTISLEFRQEESIADGRGMILKVRNPFPRPIKFRLGMMLPSGPELLKTTSCPVLPGTTTFEHWPHPIFQLAATDFRLLDGTEEGGMRCD